MGRSMPTALQALSSGSGFSFAQAVINAPQAECLIVCMRKSHSWVSQFSMTALRPVKKIDIIKVIMEFHNIVDYTSTPLTEVTSGGQ